MLQVGVPVGQGNERKEGWAWVDTQPGQDTEILEAYRLSDLVSNTLRLEVCPGHVWKALEKVFTGVCPWQL